MNCHSFFHTFKTKDKIEHLNKLKQCFDISNLDEYHEII